MKVTTCYRSADRLEFETRTLPPIPPTPIRRQLLRLPRLQSNSRFLKNTGTLTTPQPFDYRTLMPKVTTSTYAICAEGDSKFPRLKAA